jgi:hypothetical protein
MKTMQVNCHTYGTYLSLIFALLIHNEFNAKF